MAGDSKSLNSEFPAMFRPPVNRAMRVLDRSFFKKTVPLAAATVLNKTDISKVRGLLQKSKDLLELPRVSPVLQLKIGDEVRKAMLLVDGIKHDDATTWSPTITELVEKGTVGMEKYDLTLDYNFWNYADIIGAVLPEEQLADDVPMGFSIVGHVAHLNLREQWLPHKNLIAQILLDKNPTIRTVIRKTEDVGTKSEFRTFPYEVLAGEHNMNVIQHEQNCVFHFDWSRVYWNSRLETEHRRLVEKFEPGEMVCDVMAGVGPFAIPAGKKNIFVWANDLNPYGAEVLEDSIRRNKVINFVRAFNKDGRDFIRESAGELLRSKPVTVALMPKQPKANKNVPENQRPPPLPTVHYKRPKVFEHYVMNLPAIALEFLDAFPGVYAGQEDLFTPRTRQRLPMVHVYCFSGHSENEIDDHIDICNRISERIGYPLTVEDRVGGSGNQELELSIHNVRLVAPKKQMFCASFRIPREVAFCKPSQ